MAEQKQTPFGANQGFLAAIGMDAPDIASLTQARKAQRSTVRRAEAQQLGLDPGATLGYQGGQMMGDALRKLTGTEQPLVSPEEERIIRAKENSDKAMEDWIKQNPEATTKQKEQRFYETVAESAFREGLYDIGAQAQSLLEEQDRSRRVRDLELEAAGLTKTAAADRIQQQRGVGQYMPVWSKDESNPNRSRYLWVDPDTGHATLGPGGEPVFKLGEYTTQQPSQLYGSYGRSGSLAARFGSTPTAMDGLRDAHSALNRRASTLNEMRDVMEASFKTSGTAAALGGAGKFISFVNRWANDIGNVLTLAGDGTNEFTAVGRNGTEYSLDTSSGRAQFANQYRSTIKKYLPPNFTATSALADRWSSLVSELMYLEARAAEPGSKQFSDADVERMAKIIGANLNDPEALSAIITSSFQRAYEDIEYRLRVLPKGADAAIINPDARAELRQKYEQIMARWGKPLDTRQRTSAPAKQESEEEFFRRTMGQ